MHITTLRSASFVVSSSIIVRKTARPGEIIRRVVASAAFRLSRAEIINDDSAAVEIHLLLYVELEVVVRGVYSTGARDVDQILIRCTRRVSITTHTRAHVRVVLPVYICRCNDV